jgi:uncharacterized protein GlcG (DUF336 family)
MSTAHQGSCARCWRKAKRAASSCRSSRKTLACYEETKQNVSGAAEVSSVSVLLGEPRQDAIGSKPRSPLKPLERHMSVVTLAQASTIVDSALKKGPRDNCAPLTVAVLDAGGIWSRSSARTSRAAAFRHRLRQGLGRARHGLRLAHARRRAAKTPQFFTMLAAASGGRMVTNPGGVLIRNAAATSSARWISGDTRTRRGLRRAGIEAADCKPIPAQERMILRPRGAGAPAQAPTCASRLPATRTE